MVVVIILQLLYNQLVMNFSAFVKEEIQYYILHLQKHKVLLDINGDVKQEINLSFDYLSDQYLNYIEQQEQQHPEPHTTAQQLSIHVDLDFNIKITDSDLVEFWKYLDESYQVGFNIEGQDIGDQTILKIAELYKQKRCGFVKLNFAGNTRITGLSIASLGQGLQNFASIQELNLHSLQIEQSGINRVIELICLTNLSTVDFGLIGNQSLKYLSSTLENDHRIQYISFSESVKDPWGVDGKGDLQKCMRKSESCRHIHALNIYPDNLINHYELISELNIICKKNRDLKIQERQNEFKAASLNPHHDKYYEPDNHSLNAYKFSVKSYLNNVFHSLLDQALYFIQKQRRNSLREESIFNITKEPMNKIILQDICTADGSIVVLTKYLLNKIKENSAQK